MRAVRVLREVDCIACEDTRQTAKLLQHFGISNTTVSYHEHNEAARARELIERLISGADIALVSDAGTPLISDPGYRLVEAAITAGINVVPVPGASAAIAALSASGLGTDAYRFCGFLPPKSAQRRKVLEQLKSESCTLIFYETPHRILDALEDVEQVLGAGRQVVIARELTKLHEEFLRGTAQDVRQQLAARPSIKGEITLLIGKASDEVAAENEVSLTDAVLQAEANGLSRMEAIKHVARARGLNKREVYREVTEEP